MKTAPFSANQLRQSVIAVPPLARDADRNVCPEANRNIIQFIEAGGVRSLLYGGNAVFYHTGLREYDGILQLLVEQTSADTVVVPSIGPSFGIAADQIELLKQFEFPTVMLLPSRDVADQRGIATGARILAEQLGKPIVLYLKYDRWLDAGLVRSLEDDGIISWIKYAVVRDQPTHDDYLREILDVFPAARIVSGIGEQPAIIHVNDFGVANFTSGCVCVAPQQSMEMMYAIQSGNLALAEKIREWFQPLEDLRNSIHPIRVLHHAVKAAGIAETGPLQPLLSDLSDADQARILGALAVMRTSSGA